MFKIVIAPRVSTSIGFVVLSFLWPELELLLGGRFESWQFLRCPAGLGRNMGQLSVILEGDMLELGNFDGRILPS